MQQTLLFIQISESDYDESLLISRMVHQLEGEYTALCLVNGISSSLVSSHPGLIVGILTENQEESRKKFEDLLQTSRPDAIILLDLYKYFLNPLELNFLPIWLENLEMPILALDYYNLLLNDTDTLRLDSRVMLEQFEQGEAPDPLVLPVHLLKPLPLVELPEQTAPRTHYWNPVDSLLRTAAPQLRQQVLDSLGARPDARVISVFYDPTLFSRALDNALIGYYFILVEVLIYYMRQFGGQKFQLLVIGSAPPTDEVQEIPDKNFDIHYFSHLTDDNCKALISASDLIVSNTNWSPILLDAATLGTPACVFGNSILLDWKDATESEKELKSYFSPAPALYQLCEMLVYLNKWSISLPIYPFINFPNRLPDEQFPEVGLQHKGLPYFLIDTFDDESCVPLLQSLLFSQSEQQTYREYCQNWLSKAEKGQSFAQILKTVSQPENV